MINRETCNRITRHAIALKFQEDAPYDEDARRAYAKKMQSGGHLITDMAKKLCEGKAGNEIRRKLNNDFAKCVLKSNSTKIATACESIHLPGGFPSAGLSGRKHNKHSRR